MQKKLGSGSEVFFNAKKERAFVCKWVNCQAQRPPGTCISLLLVVSAPRDTKHTQIHSNEATFLQEAVTHTGHCVVPVRPVQMPSFPLYCVELYV